MYGYNEGLDGWTGKGAVVSMVKSWVCPKCLGDLATFYTEEGSTIIADARIVCPNCGHTLEGVIDECSGDEAESTTSD